MRDYSQTTLYIALTALAVALFQILFRGDGLTAFELTWNNIAAMVVILVAAYCAGMALISLHREQKKQRSKHINDKPTIRKTININLDFTAMDSGQLDMMMKHLKDMSSAQIETLLGGHHAAEIRDTTKKDDSQKEKGKESGEAEDNQRPIP